jgi:hypothetical protein
MALGRLENGNQTDTSAKDGFGWRCANQRCPANTQDNNEDDIADDPNIETAISIKNSLHNIMRMTKQQLQQNISNSQETVDALRQHTVF